MNCPDVRSELGAYVLGGLSAEERSLVDSHLFDCPVCAAELSELEELPDVLGRLTVADLSTAGFAPSPEIYDRTVTRLSAARHRGRRRAAVALAGVAGLAAAGLIGAAVSHRGPSAGPAFSATAGAVKMKVHVRDQPGGSALAVDVDGLPENERCHLVAVSTSGATEGVGSWTASYQGEATVSEASTFPASQLASIRLLGDNGATLVAVPV